MIWWILLGFGLSGVVVLLAWLLSRLPLELDDV